MLAARLMRATEMITRRQPIHRKRHVREFAPELLEAFKHLRKVFEEGGCTCPPRPPRVYPPPHWKPGDALFSDPPPRCRACKAYDKAEAEVVGLLRLKPWQLLENPYFKNPYPSGTPAWQRLEDEKKLKNDIHGGYALWRQLETACGLVPLEFDDDDDDGDQ
jgi:hypothetical protein